MEFITLYLYVIILLGLISIAVRLIEILCVVFYKAYYYVRFSIKDSEEFDETVLIERLINIRNWFLMDKELYRIEKENDERKIIITVTFTLNEIVLGYNKMFDIQKIYFLPMFYVEYINFNTGE